MMALIEWITGGVFLAVYFVPPGLTAGVLWSPFLVSERVRSVFDKTSVPIYVAYPVFCVAAAVPYLLGVGAIFILDSTGTAGYSNVIINLSVVMTLLYTIGFPSLAVLVHPRLGYGWEDDGHVTTWLVLGVSGLWYGIVMSVPLVLFAVVLALPGGY